LQGSQYFSLHIIAYYHIVLPPTSAYFLFPSTIPLQGKWSLGKPPDPPTLELFNHIFRILMEQFTVDNTSSTSSTLMVRSLLRIPPQYSVLRPLSQTAGCKLLDVARWALSPHARIFTTVSSGFLNLGPKFAFG